MQATVGFALHRALLRATTKLSIQDQAYNAIQRRTAEGIGDRFRHHAKSQGPIEIVMALRYGYQLTIFKALDILHNAVNGDMDARERIVKELDGLKVKSPRRSPARQRERGRASITPNPQDETRRSAVIPNKHSILERPYPVLSGRRTVPHLINTNGVPFLRYSRPQSPTLSRVILDKIKTYDRRIGRKYELQNQVQMAKLEDAWDTDLSQYCGLSIPDDPDPLWRKEPYCALNDFHTMLKRNTERTRELGLDMYRVLEKERALAEKERLARRDERHRRNKAKRLARREAQELDQGDPAEMM
ncbi:MAG: hypothetical protein Q9195_009405 [Heterodermia aff. obscurata]